MVKTVRLYTAVILTFIAMLLIKLSSFISGVRKPKETAQFLADKIFKD